MSLRYGQSRNTLNLNKISHGRYLYDDILRRFYYFFNVDICSYYVQSIRDMANLDIHQF